MTPPSNYRVERSTISRISGNLSIQRTIATLEARILDCLTFYHWPALADSWREDVEELRKRLVDGQSKISE
jgi:hypothetical protein